MNRYPTVENNSRDGCAGVMYPSELEGFDQMDSLSKKIVQTWVTYGLAFAAYRVIFHYTVGKQEGPLFDMIFLQAAVFALIGFSLYYIFVEPLLKPGDGFIEQLISDILFFGLAILAVSTLLPLANGKPIVFDYHPLLVIVVAMLGYHLFREVSGINKFQLIGKILFIVLAQLIM